MEKRELSEAQCPILKQTATEETTHTILSVNENPSAQAQAPAEERRVVFDIGDSDDGDVKERKVAFDIGDSDDADHDNTNDGKYATLCH